MSQATPATMAFRFNMIPFAVVVLFVGVAPVLGLETILTDFETFTLGSVNGQGGWRVTNPNFDQEVVTINDPVVGNKAWRFSNKFGQGSFGDQSFSPSLSAVEPKFISGETDAYDVTGSLAAEFQANTRTFYGAWSFKSVTGAAQPGLSITVSADDGSGSRQTWVTMVDNGVDGIDVTYYDAVPYPGIGDGAVDWRFTTLATGLSYTDWHRIEMAIEYVDSDSAQECRVGVSQGELSNDDVKIYIDGVLVNPYRLTTWEWYFANTNEGSPAPWQRIRASTRLLFRTAGSVSANDGFGYYFDDVEVSAIIPATAPPTSSPTTSAPTNKGGNPKGGGKKTTGVATSHSSTGTTSSAGIIAGGAAAALAVTLVVAFGVRRSRRHGVSAEDAESCEEPQTVRWLIIIEQHPSLCGLFMVAYES